MRRREARVEEFDGGYTVALPVFEGPMDLLLHLVTKNRIDIHDIPIHEITDQYLDYLDRARAFDLPLASSFFSMAATLLLIKSRMLLPRHRDEETEDEDPRQELAQSLEDFRRMKELRAYVEELLEKEAPYRRREAGEIVISEYTGKIPISRLMAALSEIFEERAAEIPRVIDAEEVSFSGKTEELRRFLSGGHAKSLREFFCLQHSRVALAVSLVAILEAIRTGEIVLEDTAAGPSIRRICFD